MFRAVTVYASNVDTVNHAAAIYARQSKAKDRSIAEQIDAGKTACEREGRTVAEVYSDRVSASRFARGDRPGWNRLLADLEAGRFGMLVLWESSRGDRNAETWLGLLRRCRDHRVLIHVIADGRTYDMSRRRDWKSLADDGVDNADESEKTRDRIMRAVTANAHAGRPHGPAEYGYVRIYDERTKKLSEQRPHPGHAAIVRDIIRRAAADIPLKTITDDLNERGVPAPRGGQWERSTVRKICRNPAYIGKRKWNGELYDAIWPPLVDEATFWRVERILTDERRKTTRPGRQKWLLSYYATCGVCKKPLQTFSRPGRQPMYGCSSGNGCVYISMAIADLAVSERVIAYLSRPDVYPALNRNDDAHIIAARSEAARLQAELDQWAQADVTARAYKLREAKLRPQIEAAEKRALAPALPVAVADLAGAEADVRQRWEVLPVAVRREVIRALSISVEVVKSVGAGGNRIPADMRVKVERRTG